MSDQPPILEYGTERTPKAVSSSMTGPNLVIVLGLIFCWYGIQSRVAVGLLTFAVGGCLVLAGFKQHVN